MDNEGTAQLLKQGNDAETDIENESRQLEEEADDVESRDQSIDSRVGSENAIDQPTSEDTPLDNDQALKTVATDLVHSILEAEGATSNSTSGISTPKDNPPGDVAEEKPAPDSEQKEETTETINDEKQPEFVISAEDPYLKATKFLEKHQLLTLLQTLTADIVLKRPAQPLDFMIDEIETIQEQDRQRKGVFLNVNKQASSSEQTETNDFGKEEIVDMFDK